MGTGRTLASVRSTRLDRIATCARLLCVLALSATPAAAQSTTEDGIRAALHGDYKAAVAILRPLADAISAPDPVAQFFLAVLYETGNGVRADMARACGLFARSALRDHPFAEQSAAIAGNMRNQLGDGASMLCVANEAWRGGPPQSIDLGPGHRITFSDTSVVVTHAEQETRTLWVLPSEAVVLPIQYTPLNVSRPVSLRRHFLQFFQWMPDESAKPSSWTLTWGLSEVIGDQWLVVAYDTSLAVVNSPSRPDALDLSSFVRLRVNAGGEAEFSVTGGTRPRTEVIPSKAGQ
jgi:hypothetical protein